MNKKIKNCLLVISCLMLLSSVLPITTQALTDESDSEYEGSLAYTTLFKIDDLYHGYLIVVSQMANASGANFFDILVHAEIFKNGSRAPDFPFKLRIFDSQGSYSDSDEQYINPEREDAHGYKTRKLGIMVHMDSKLDFYAEIWDTTGSIRHSYIFLTWGYDKDAEPDIIMDEDDAVSTVSFELFRDFKWYWADMSGLIFGNAGIYFMRWLIKRSLGK